MRKIRWKKIHSDKYSLDIDLPFGDSLYIDIYRENGYWESCDYSFCEDKYISKKFLKLDCCQKYVVDKVLKELSKYKKLEIDLKNI
jgi:hypothetical protein